MRYSIEQRAVLLDFESGNECSDGGLMQSSGRVELDSNRLADYLDDDLAEAGITGGATSCRRDPDGGLRLVADYWSYRSLSRSMLRALIDFTTSQWEDGVGENGFPIVHNGQEFVVQPLSDGEVTWSISEDGVETKAPSEIAIQARKGNLAALRLELAHSSDIDQKLRGYTGLHLAILHCHLDVALELINSGARPNALDKDGNTPLHLCALSRELDDMSAARIVRCLIDHGADSSLKTADGATAAELASERGKVEMSRTLK